MGNQKSRILQKNVFHTLLLLVNIQNSWKTLPWPSFDTCIQFLLFETKIGSCIDAKEKLLQWSDWLWLLPKHSTGIIKFLQHGCFGSFWSNPLYKGQ